MAYREINQNGDLGIVCDDCSTLGPNMPDPGTLAAPLLRSEARREGWSHAPFNDLDFCPKCKQAGSPVLALAL